ERFGAIRCGGDHGVRLRAAQPSTRGPENRGRGTGRSPFRRVPARERLLLLRGSPLLRRGLLGRGPLLGGGLLRGSPLLRDGPLLGGGLLLGGRPLLRGRHRSPPFHTSGRHALQASPFPFAHPTPHAVPLIS